MLPKPRATSSFGPGPSLLRQLNSRFHHQFRDPRTPRTQRENYITRYGRAVRHLAQCTRLAPEAALHIFDTCTGKKENIDSLRRGKDGATWNRSLANEWGRLAQDNIHDVISTDTIEFIFKQDAPQGRRVTYATYVFDYRPLKM